MDNAIWAIWYDLEDNNDQEYFEWMHNGVYYELLTANVPRDLFKEMMTRYRDLSFLARYHRGYEFAGWLSGAGSKHLTNRAMIREYLRQHLPHREIHAA